MFSFARLWADRRLVRQNAEYVRQIKHLSNEIDGLRRINIALQRTSDGAYEELTKSRRAFQQFTVDVAAIREAVASMRELVQQAYGQRDPQDE